MNKFFKKLGAAGLLAGMMMVAGCGDDSTSSPTGVSSSTVIPATSVEAAPPGAPAGSISTKVSIIAPASATVGTKTLTAAITIPAGVTITPPSGSTFSLTSPPTIVVTIPVDGKTSGVPRITVGSTSFVVANADGAADFSLAGYTSFTVGGVGATVRIPVLTVPATPIRVVMIKPSGKTYTITAGVTYDAATSSVTVPGVTDFCHGVVNPQSVSGTGGFTPIIF